MSAPSPVANKPPTCARKQNQPKPNDECLPNICPHRCQTAATYSLPAATKIFCAAMRHSASLFDKCLFLIAQAKPITASTAHVYLCPADVASAGAAHPSVFCLFDFAAPAWLFSRLHKPNPVSHFRCAHFTGPVLTYQIFSSSMLLLSPRNTCSTCAAARLNPIFASQMEIPRQLAASGANHVGQTGNGSKQTPLQTKLL